MQQQGPDEAERVRKAGQPWLARDPVEDGIEIVQCVTDLVQGQRHRLVGRLLLEEEADRPARFLEVEILGTTLVAGREDRARRAGIEAGDQFRRPRLQRVAIGRRQKVFQDQKAVARVSRQIGHAHRTMRSMTTGRSATG